MMKSYHNTNFATKIKTYISGIGESDYESDTDFDSSDSSRSHDEDTDDESSEVDDDIVPTVEDACFWEIRCPRCKRGYLRCRFNKDKMRCIFILPQAKRYHTDTHQFNLPDDMPTVFGVGRGDRVHLTDQKVMVKPHERCYSSANPRVTIVLRYDTPVLDFVDRKRYLYQHALEVMCRTMCKCRRERTDCLWHCDGCIRDFCSDCNYGI